MPEGTQILKQYYAIDLETDITYSFRIDPSGECVAAEPWPTSIGGKYDIRPVSVSDPVRPFGQTIVAVEMKNGTLNDYSPTVKVFTMAWPTKEEWSKGNRPVVTSKDLPRDLIKAGIAAPPKGPQPKPTGEAALEEAMKNINGMIGLDSAKHDIMQNINVARFNELKRELGMEVNPISRHMVFTGNPGTGKTTFAREVAKVYKALGFIKKDTVLEVKREDLVAGYVGQTALKTKEVIEKARGGVLFIDEAYALSRSADSPGGSNDFGREAIDTLVAAMENMRDDLVVIVAGYQEPMKKFIDANEGLKSRFMTYITFEDYSVKQLGEILDSMIKQRGYTLEPAAREEAMKKLEAEKARAKPKEFGNGRIVRNLVEKAEKELAERADKEGWLKKDRAGLNTEQLKKAVSTLTLSDIKGVSLDSLTSKSPSGLDFDVAAAVKKTPPANDAPANDTGPADVAKKKSAKASFKP